MTPSPNPLPLKGARAYSFFLSPLPVGEGWVRAFLVSLSRVPREGGDPDPFTQTENSPLAPCLHRVIASEATQWTDTDLSRCSPGLLRRDAPRNDAGGGDPFFRFTSPTLCQPNHMGLNQPVF